MITVQRPLYNQRVLTPKFYCLGAEFYVGLFDRGNSLMLYPFTFCY